MAARTWLRWAVVAALSIAICGGACAAAAPRVRASLPAIEQQVMCVTCGIPLAIAQSPQADRERAYIRALIAQGEDEAQIKRALVGQFGPAVLALPKAHGFNLAVYVVPLALLVLLGGALAIALPRWRRRAGKTDGPEGTAESLLAEDEARLEADLERYR